MYYQTGEYGEIQKQAVIELQCPTLFKTIGINVLYKEKEKPSRQKIGCPECGGISFIHDRTGLRLVCQNCGLVLDEETENVYKPSITGIDRSEIAPRTYKRNEFRKSDFIECVNPTAYRRILSRDGYYTSDEKRRNEVDSIFKRFSSDLEYPSYVIDHAWRHYQKIGGDDFFTGRSMLSICSAIVFISLLQCGIPIQLSQFVNAVNSRIGEITKRDVYKAKYYVIDRSKKMGYDIGKIMPTDDDIITSIINRLRELYKKKERELSILLIETKKILKPAKSLLRFHGSPFSIIPSVMLYVSRKHTLSVLDTELKEASTTSLQSIREKCEILERKIGKRKNKKNLDRYM